MVQSSKFPNLKIACTRHVSWGDESWGILEGLDSLSSEARDFASPALSHGNLPLYERTLSCRCAAALLSRPATIISSYGRTWDELDSVGAQPPDDEQAYMAGLGPGSVDPELSSHYHHHHAHDPESAHLGEMHSEHDLLTRCKLLEAENRLLRAQVGELSNLKWQVNVLVSALEKLGCSSASASALLNASVSHVGHPGHLQEDPRGMEAAMPLPHPLAPMQDVGLPHHAMLHPHMSAMSSYGGQPEDAGIISPGLPARDGLCRIPNPPISPTLGKSIQAIWLEHTLGRPPDFPSVEQLTRDHGKKWKLKEYGYNSRVAEKKGVIVKRIKEFIMSGYTQEMAIAALEKEQAVSKMPLSRFIDSIRPGKGKRKAKDSGIQSESSELEQPLGMQPCVPEDHLHAEVEHASIRPL